MHPRTLIRHAATALLKSHPDLQSACGARIFPSREEHFLEEDLPAVGVYTLDEQVIDTSDRAPRPDWRSLTLAVEILDKAAPTLDDAIDALAALVEEALGSPSAFSAVIRKEFQCESPIMEIAYQSTDIEFASDGKRVMGIATLNYQIEYENSRPPDDLPDFLRGGVNWHSSEPAGGIPDAEDLITVREQE